MTGFEVLLFIGLTHAATIAPSDDWSASAEAYFLTSLERQEWKTLQSDEARAQFRNLYWRRRDPTPETERNEFRELVSARISKADARFAIGKIAGSRTGRGMVFIVLGPPAAERQTIGPLNSAPQMIAPGRIGIPSEAFDNREWHTWVYDRENAADVLTALGVPSLEVAFIVEPGRRDEIQNASYFQRWKEILACRTIVEGAAR